METPLLLGAAIVLLIVIAVIKNITALFKRSQGWENDHGLDRAERREHDWYWHTDSEKSREFNARRR